MTTTYSLSIPQGNATDNMFRLALSGVYPKKEQDRRFCDLITRLHDVSDNIEQMQPWNDFSAAMKWGLQKMVDATTANVMNTRLLKNDRDVFRTLNEMEKRTARFERILGTYGWKELYA